MASILAHDAIPRQIDTLEDALQTKHKRKASQVLKDAHGKIEQAINALWKRTRRGNGTFQGTSYCAMGVLAKEAGMRNINKIGSNDYPQILNEYDIAPFEQKIHCHVCKKHSTTALDIAIVHLNDEHLWNFVQIGNWLEERGY